MRSSGVVGADADDVNCAVRNAGAKRSATSRSAASRFKEKNPWAWVLSRGIGLSVEHKGAGASSSSCSAVHLASGGSPGPEQAIQRGAADAELARAFELVAVVQIKNHVDVVENDSVEVEDLR